MATDLTHQDDFKGSTSNSLMNADIKKVVTIKGITPDDFIKDDGSVEFDFKALVNTFAVYCKDFNDNLEINKKSKALEFSAKLIFELGIYIRNERKTVRDKAVRFRFPYKEEDGELIKVVTVRTFRHTVYKNMEEDGKMVMSFKQASLLAMITFDKALRLAYQENGSILMSPLCCAVFSRESIPIMARALKMEVVEVISMVNQSTCRGGEYLPNSDLACAIVWIISATKRMTNPNVRSQLITILIKQYAAKHKVYYSERFNVFAQHALDGVSTGFDAEALIQNSSNIQVQEINRRAQAIAIMQCEVKVHVPTRALEALNIIGDY